MRYHYTDAWLLAGWALIQLFQICRGSAVSWLGLVNQSVGFVVDHGTAVYSFWRGQQC